MISKEELRALIDKVCFKTGKKQEAIALELNYGKNYISEMLSPTGKVTDKFLVLFNLKYGALLENPKNGGEDAGASAHESVEGGNNLGASGKILEAMLSIIDTQTTILKDIRDGMARADAQARMEANLNRVFGGVETVGERQNHAIKQILLDLAEIKGKIDGLSEG